jgi:hypothetical protein
MAWVLNKKQPRLTIKVNVLDIQNIAPQREWILILNLQQIDWILLRSDLYLTFFLASF